MRRGKTRTLDVMIATVGLALVLAFGAAPVLAENEAPAWLERGWCKFDPSLRPLPPRLNLPRWVCETTYKRGLQRTYVPYTGMNPFFISGDFDADGKSDVAIWVTNTKSRKRGILFLTQGSNRVFVAGAGADAQERGDDYTYVDVWSVIPKGEVLESHHEDHKVTLKGDAIIAEKSESAAFAVYWDGKRFRFFQLTD
jgi:hypothetical protein